jgi:hypothetical protein
MVTMFQSQGRRVVFTRRHARRVDAARRARAARSRVAQAFREMLHGIAEKAAWARTMAFWRASLQM